ncbi:MAG TPA: hypothetical protein VIM29_13930 [Bacillota bacterium]
MDWLDRFNAAIDYIENNLDMKLELDCPKCPVITGLIDVDGEDYVFQLTDK